MLIFDEYAGGSQRKSAKSLGTYDDDSVSSSSADMSKLTLASGTEAVQQDSSLDSWLEALYEKRYLVCYSLINCTILCYMQRYNPIGQLLLVVALYSVTSIELNFVVFTSPQLSELSKK